jgi:hypothetical protein
MLARCTTTVELPRSANALTAPVPQSRVTTSPAKKWLAGYELIGDPTQLQHLDLAVLATDG